MSQWCTQSEFADVPLPKRFIARQPILDRGRNTFGYELLFRESWENRFSGDAEGSSQTVIDNTLLYGIESLVGAAVPFVNCTYSVLVDDFASMLPRGSVLEILEDVTVDERLLLACKRLRSLGYRIALDDFDFDPRWQPLLEIADFIKIDFLNSSAPQRESLLRRFSRRKTLFIAEKIENEVEFQKAFREGFHLFQGYFFARPVVVARPAIGTLAQKLQLAQVVRAPDLSTEKILKLLKQETSIALRLLRLANSAAAGARDRISEPRTALAMVGQQRFRQLALATLVSELATNRVPELQRSILQRSSFCEAMAADLGNDPNQMFFFGVFSLLQPILDLTPQEVLDTVHLDSTLIDALFGTINPARLLIDTFSHFERGRWHEFTSSADRLGLSEAKLAQRYHMAQSWAAQVLQAAMPDTASTGETMTYSAC